jgi:hypothetical protein
MTEPTVKIIPVTAPGKFNCTNACTVELHGHPMSVSTHPVNRVYSVICPAFTVCRMELSFIPNRDLQLAVDAVVKNELAVAFSAFRWVRKDES